tara:strand:- start:520 stop:1827 length:1308 start_codon:yes stop_codon:yes gene_type:complete
MSTIAKKIAFHTLGCKLNFSETSTLSRDSLKYGYEKVDSKEFADIYVFNTCSVTENANKETRKLIRRSKRINPNAFITLIGCYAQLKPEELIDIEEVNLVLGMEDKFELLSHLDKINFQENTKSSYSGSINNVKTFEPSYSKDDRTRSFLKVQDGCDYNCTFCTIPLARGKSRSTSIKKIVNIAKDISNTNTKEIVLTGVNIGDFGNGANENFYDLIRQLDKNVDIERIRISSIEPNLLNDEIIEFCFSSKKLMPHFHMPLQSGSDRMLKSMKRRYTTGLYLDRIDKIKSLDQDACIGVDVIVGYPTESDEDFLATYNFLKSKDVSYLHVFTYSERENTEAVNLKPVVPHSERSRRSKILHELSDQKKSAFYEKSVGKIKTVLIEKSKNGALFGYTDNYVKTKIQGPISLENTIQSVFISEAKLGYVECEVLTIS